MSQPKVTLSKTETKPAPETWSTLNTNYPKGYVDYTYNKPDQRQNGTCSRFYHWESSLSKQTVPVPVNTQYKHIVTSLVRASTQFQSNIHMIPQCSIIMSCRNIVVLIGDLQLFTLHHRWCNISLLFGVCCFFIYWLAYYLIYVHKTEMDRQRWIKGW